MTQFQTQKRKMPVYGNDNVLESLRGVGSSIGTTVVKDVLAPVGTDVIQSIFGATPKSGELHQNQAIEFTTRKEATPIPQANRIETFQKTSNSDEQEVRQKIDKIRVELHALSQSVRGLRQEISKTIIETPINPGVYHLNFLEHLQSYIKMMKQEIDDSRTWLMAANTRKAKKGYWGQYKKHGTTFGLSHERSVATSAG